MAALRYSIALQTLMPGAVIESRLEQVPVQEPVQEFAGSRLFHRVEFAVESRNPLPGWETHSHLTAAAKAGLKSMLPWRSLP
jgi:hypothetical protein